MFGTQAEMTMLRELFQQALRKRDVSLGRKPAIYRVLADRTFGAKLWHDYWLLTTGFGVVGSPRIVVCSLEVPGALAQRPLPEQLTVIRQLIAEGAMTVDEDEGSSARVFRKIKQPPPAAPEPPKRAAGILFRVGKA